MYKNAQKWKNEAQVEVMMLRAKVERRSSSRYLQALSDEDDLYLDFK